MPLALKANLLKIWRGDLAYGCALLLLFESGMDVLNSQIYLTVVPLVFSIMVVASVGKRNAALIA